MTKLQSAALHPIVCVLSFVLVLLIWVM